MIPFPEISPEIFSFNIFGVEIAIRWYALSYIAGFFCALKVMKLLIRKDHLWRDRKPVLNLDQADQILTYLILGVIIGGRLGYVLFYNLQYYVSRPIDILRVWDGGMSFHGGFLGVVVAVLFFCRANSIPLWSGADLIAVASPPGLFFGRVANFINAELWGKPTTMPWGVIFPGERAQQCVGIDGPCARHPSQLYEAGMEGIILFLALMLISNLGGLKRPGLVTGVFALGYGISRFLIEYFRVPDPQFVSFENVYGFAFAIGSFGISMGQALSLPMVFAGLALIIFSTRRSGNI